MNELNLFFSEAQIIILFSKLVLGVILAFLAILAWRKTEENYIMFFILGVFFEYADVLYKTVSHLGFIGKDILIIANIPMGRMILENLSFVFFIIAFSVFLKEKKI